MFIINLFAGSVMKNHLSVFMLIVDTSLPADAKVNFQLTKVIIEDIFFHFKVLSNDHCYTITLNEHPLTSDLTN